MTLKECIEKQTPKTIEKINKEYSDTKLTKEQLEEQIFLSFPVKSLTFTDKELKCLYNLKENKKTDKIEKYLTNMGFVYKIKDKYILPEEISMLIEALKSPEYKKERLIFIISFYILSNGVIEITKLVELINKSGVKVTKEEVKKYAKANDLIIEKEKVYLDEMAKKESKTIADYVNEYKVFNLKKIINIVNIKENYLPQELSKKLKNKVSKKYNFDMIINYIIFSISLGVNEELLINSLLENKTIKLTKKEKEELLELIEHVSNIIPKWIYGGYSLFEMLGLEDEREMAIKEIASKRNFLDSLEEIYDYILAYLNINGVIDIDVLMDILNSHNSLNITKKEIIQTIEDDDYIKVYKNYLNILDNDAESIKMLLEIKEKNKEYKKIDDPNKILDEYDNNFKEFETLLKEYNIIGEAKDMILSAMMLHSIDEQSLQIISKYYKLNINSKDTKQIIKELNSVRRQMRCWELNGFKPSEINNSISSKEKIGRNDLCPCGSGLKHKKCCGK